MYLIKIIILYLRLPHNCVLRYLGQGTNFFFFFVYWWTIYVQLSTHVIQWQRIYVSNKEPDIYDRETRFGYTCFSLSIPPGIVQVHSSGNLPLLGRATYKPRVPISWPRRAHQQRGTSAESAHTCHVRTFCSPDRRVASQSVSDVVVLTWLWRVSHLDLAEDDAAAWYAARMPHTLELKTARVFREEIILNRYVFIASEEKSELYWERYLVKVW